MEPPANRRPHVATDLFRGALAGTVANGGYGKAQRGWTTSRPPTFVSGSGGHATGRSASVTAAQKAADIDGIEHADASATGVRDAASVAAHARCLGRHLAFGR
jgi:hypothetical protein